MTEVPDAETMKAFNKNIVDEFRANGGKVGGPFEGATLLLLTSTGAKSGQPRLAPLAYLTIDGKMIIIGSKAARTPIPTGCTTFGPTRARTSKSEPTPTTSPPASCRPRSATRRSRRSSRSAPGFGDYQAKTSRVIPLFELQRA